MAGDESFRQWLSWVVGTLLERHGTPWAGAIGGVIGEDGDAVAAGDRAIAVIHHLFHERDGSVGGDRGRCPWVDECVLEPLPGS